MKQIIQERFNKLYDKPTLIQNKVYHPLLNDEDVLGLSPTGSGKTLAFLLPLLSKINSSEGTQLLILEPSQELAIQVANVARSWAKLFNLKVTALNGGANVKRQEEKLKKHPEVVIGTPGRIISLINKKKLKTHLFNSAVVDEADDLLHGETLDTVRSIFQASPANVQISFFSATDNPILHEIHKWFGKHVYRIDVRNLDKTRGKVRHRLFKVRLKNRNKILNYFLNIKGFKALVFFDDMKNLNRTLSYFRHSNIHNVAKLTSGQRQVERQKALKRFRLGQVKLLLTTEVASRGLDIIKLPAVINYDLPKTKNSYIHRSGRTGRMGENGLVINFGDDHDFRDLKNLLDNDYQFKPIYFYANKLLDNESEVISAKNKQKLINRHKNINKGHGYKNNNQSKKKTKKKIRHRKKKNSKNKGMRHKWHEMDQKNYKK